MLHRFHVAFVLAGIALSALRSSRGDVDALILKENLEKGAKSAPTAPVGDLAFLRRASIDLIGRIPTGDEIDEFQGWPRATRRTRLVDKLIASDRFADRWTVFFGDMLRLRSNATGGGALTAYVHQALENNTPYDELVRRLISTNGKANKTPEVGFILGDDADPFSLASVTSQVFLGVRIGCAQCHDHPFDVWTREDFYGIAAYFGKTRRVASNLTRVVYTTEADKTAVLWPPEDDADGDQRRPMRPRFPFELISVRGGKPEFIQRFEATLAKRVKANGKDAGPSLDDLLAAGDSPSRPKGNGVGARIVGDAKQSLRKIDVKAALYRPSELRAELAELITSPRNSYFAESLVNRLWKELVGRGFVEPVDDFRADNLPSHPRSLEYLGREFVASGFDFRRLVRTIALSDAYQRKHAPPAADETHRELLESHFLATPMRRMLSESLFDSIVTAGHLFDYKHPSGANPRVIQERVRVMVSPGKEEETPQRGNLVEQVAEGAGRSMRMAAPGMSGGGYALEDAIEVDFKSLLKQKDEMPIEQMQVMSKEELEAQRLLQERMRRKAGAKYETRIVERKVDDNPKFNSSLRIAAPAPPGHFIRVFGQTSRTDLGEERTSYSTMRQALMMLNGRLTNEAARVGSMEPMHALLAGPKKNLDEAVRLAYREILTRDPSQAELGEAKSLLGDDPLHGMTDLRWVLLNCNEFRFLP